jgi:type VII secretion protein EccB
MQSRRDQVEAQSYLLSRLTSALLRAEPDGLEPPTKRDTRALVAGLVVTLLALGGLAVWSLFSSGGSTAWRAAGTLIVDKSSGSRFMLLDGHLRPVMNLASARLVAGSGLKTATVATKQLTNVPRGEPIGIQGAPDMLPASNLLNQGVWRVCLAAPDAAGTGGGRPGTVVQIGASPATDRLGDDEALYVAAGTKTYLIWRGQRLAIGPAWVPDVLGFGTAVATPVSPQWIDLLPAGPPLAPTVLPARGQPGPLVAGQPAIVGEVFQSGSGAATAHYLTLRHGLAPLTATQYALASAESGVPAERPITAAQLARARRVSMPVASAALPVAPPEVHALARGVSACLEYPGQVDPKAVDVVRSAVPAGERPTTTAATTLAVTPDGGALVGTDLAAALKDQPHALIDDTGRAFPLTGDALTALGYSPAEGVLVPLAWLSLLPRGPLLTTPGKG